MRTGKAVLNVEQLETRDVPTTATLSNGILRVTGTAAADVIRLTQNATQITVEGVRTFNTDQVHVISVDAGAGDDRVDLRGVTVGSLRTEVYGRDGNDWIWGSVGGREPPPRDTGPQDEEDTRDNPPRLTRFSSGELHIAVSLALGNQRFQAFPEAIGQNRLSHEGDLLSRSPSNTS